MHVGLSRIACERGDLDAADEHLRRAADFGEHAGLPQNPYRRRAAAARIREARGDPDGALHLLDEAQRVYLADFSPDVRPIAATRARVLAAHGRVGEALHWAREHGVAVDDALSYLREYEHVTLARALLASGAVPDSARLLERLLAAAEAGERGGSVVEILVLQALAGHAAGDARGASASLQRALSLAAPEGYVRVFVDEGAPMAALLRLVARQPARDHADRLLRFFDPRGPVVARRAPGPVEPLSARELDVLRLLSTDLDGPAIARELVVSLNTLRTHTKNIYAKLGVNNRRAAVRQARELDLLRRTGPR
jgi:LuxR family maltose regulon positive regulatory protein